MLQAALAIDEGARGSPVLVELGIGTNPGIKEYTGSVLFVGAGRPTPTEN